MFYLKLNYNQLITLKTFYFKYRKDSIDDDIHELLQDKVDSYHYQRDYKNISRKISADYLYDDGKGNLTRGSGGSGSINYETGEISFSNCPIFHSSWSA